jgi:hypothetical protein
LHLKGAYTLTEEDVLDGRTFDDSIALGGYPMDIHGVAGTGNRFVLLKKSYEIPYRCIYTVGCKNLLGTGRLISAEGGAFGSVRINRMYGCRRGYRNRRGMAAKAGISVGQVDTARFAERCAM